MKYYVIAGEASGDLHGSNLIKALKNIDNQSDFRVWGGDLMQKAGASLVKHYRDLAFMGFVEVLSNLRTILKNIDFCKKDILDYQPDALILIDYPGFNLRIAKWAKSQHIKVFYYISPQIWAWKENRVHKIKRDIDHLFVILPFEKDFYKKHGKEVDYVGHPLLDAIQHFEKNPDFYAENQLTKQPIIALLPGSRKQEISKMLSEMLSVVPFFKSFQFVIAGAPSITKAFYEPFIKDFDNVALIQNKTYALLSHAQAALVTSGTATLETALFGVPEVVCYKGSAISYAIAKRLVKLKYISLVNLIADKPIVKELIQSDCNTKNLQAELSKLLEPQTRNAILQDYQYLYQQLGEGGASKRVAALIFGYLNEEKN